VDLLVKKNRSFTLISNFLFDESILQHLIEANKKLDISYLVNATDLDFKDRMTVWGKNYNSVYSSLYSRDAEEAISVGLTIYNKDLSYYINYLDFLVKSVSAIERLRISINFPGNKEDKNNFYFINNLNLGKIVLGLIAKSVSLGIKPSIDCIVFPCMFSNKEEYKYAKRFTDSMKLRCGQEGAPADIFPDETMSYCYPLKESVKVNTKNFEKMETAVEDMMLKYKILESQVNVPNTCQECTFYKKMCNGPCLGFYDLSGETLGVSL